MLSSQASSAVASRYVGALIDLCEEAKDSKVLTQVEADFSDLSKTLTASDDFKAMIRSPLIGREKQLAFVDALAKKAKLHDLSANFLRVLVQNRRLNVLPAALEAFQKELSARRGEILAHVKTAQDLSAKQVKSIQDTLKKQTGADVLLDVEADPSILGGMVVTVGSQMIDDSVRRKLDRLKNQMGANENSALKEAM